MLVEITKDIKYRKNTCFLKKEKIRNNVMCDLRKKLNFQPSQNSKKSLPF